MNFEIFYISMSITVCLLVAMVWVVYLLGLNRPIKGISLICGATVFLLIIFLPIPNDVENKLNLLTLNVKTTQIDVDVLDAKINSICEDQVIRGYEYFEFSRLIEVLINKAVKEKGFFEDKELNEFDQICQ